jgi:PhzF family phenazine biosynthesis protein
MISAARPPASLRRPEPPVAARAACQDRPMTQALRYSAFTDSPDGGNPAGVVLDATGMGDEEMQRIAAEVGYSETAFLAPRADGDYDVRYFSPAREIAFCGHATIASAVALAEREGAKPLVFHTREGAVPVATTADHGAVTATLTSVKPYVEPVPDRLLEAALSALHWDAADLDPQLPPRIAYAGVRHLVLAAATRQRLAALDYDFEPLRQAMLAHDLTTLQLVHRAGADTFDARDPFPVGGVVEDPATGAAAAALGAYLRELGLIAPPARILIRQGDDMGRPSRLTVDVGHEPEIRVTGRAVDLTPSAGRPLASRATEAAG